MTIRKKVMLVLPACIGLAVSCRFWGHDYQPPKPLASSWCDKFDAEPIPDRDAPYLIEGEWVDDLTGERRMTFYPDGATDNDQVRWRIENVKYHRLVGNEPHEFYVYTRGDRNCTVRAIAVDEMYMVIRDLEVEEVFIKAVAQPGAPLIEPPDGGIDAGPSDSDSGSERGSASISRESATSPGGSRWRSARFERRWRYPSYRRCGPCRCSRSWGSG